MTTIYLKSLNRRRASRSNTRGRYIALADQSASQEGNGHMEEGRNLLDVEGVGGFADVTDLANKDFDYVL